MGAAVAKSRPASDPIWSRAHGPADAEVASMEAAWLEAVARMQGSMPLAAVRRALASGDVEAAIRAIDWQKALDDPLMEVWRPALRRAAAIAAQRAVVEVPQRFGIRFGFDLRDPGFYRAVDAHAMRLVREVSDSTRKALGEIVKQAYADGLHPYQFADTIRQTVGLTNRMQGAVLRYRAGLLKDATTRTQVERVDRLVERYAERLHRNRARLIARTETLRASNTGRYATFDQAADAGYVARGTATVEWLTAEDERVCPVCAPMDGTTTPLDHPFQTDLGAFLHPPIHPACRCVTLLHPG